MVFGASEFADNPEPRCPCLLLLDTSGSMDGPAIEELNNGLILFKHELSADALAMKRVEVAVVTFGPGADAGRLPHPRCVPAAAARGLGRHADGSGDRRRAGDDPAPQDRLQGERHLLLPAVGLPDHRRRADRSLGPRRRDGAGRRGGQGLLVLRRRRRPGGHGRAVRHRGSSAAQARRPALLRPVRLAVVVAQQPVALHVSRPPDLPPAWWAQR